MIDPATSIGAVHLTISDLERSAPIPWISTICWRTAITAAIGLRHFVVRLPGSGALADVTERVRDAGVATEVVDGGVLVRDPARNAILLTTLSSQRSPLTF